MRTVRRLLGRLAREEGSIAVEAMICIPFLFLMILAMWGAANVMYNQTVLNDATAISAEGALTVYSRLSDFDGNCAAVGVSNPAACPSFTAADKVAGVLLRENTANLLNTDLTYAKPTVGAAATRGKYLALTCYADRIPQPAGTVPCTGPHGSERSSVIGEARMSLLGLAYSRPRTEAEIPTHSRLDVITLRGEGEQTLVRPENR